MLPHAVTNIYVRRSTRSNRCSKIFIIEKKKQYSVDKNSIYTYFVEYKEEKSSSQQITSKLFLYLLF